MQFFRSLAFTVFFFGYTLIHAVALLFFCLPRSPEPLIRGVRAWCRVVLWGARVMAGIRYEVRGLENVPADTAVVLCAKHQSYFDPIVKYYLLPGFTALAKKELFAIPIISTLLKKAGIIRVDRGAGTAHKQMPAARDAVIKARRPVVVYPEGTRVPPGKYRRLKSGTYYLQETGELPVVTIATNSGLFWGRRRFMKYPGTIVVEFHTPMPAGLGKDAFMALLSERVIDRSNQLMVDARQAGTGAPVAVEDILSAKPSAMAAE
ncbi:MAG: 1-acyl-sn-glycerol-3-phosphate acyltransferase [Sphingomonadales bacterium]|nr:1-acyl-sn-glycerol-3-phosphate acyltransferase [Sphingomonadales bacterium]